MDKTLRFIERSTNEFHKTKFFKTDYGFEEAYFNLDATSGGQLVYNQYPYELIREANKQGNVESFFAYLTENCKEFLVDIDDEDFLDYAYEFVAKDAEYSKNDKEIAYGMIIATNEYFNE
ncbi:MAG: hypothetical protein E7473_01240 [Ruminococcaceae bacterium]|nr:hypothetical protein [Oscillospiraceae bacterium]